MGKKTEILRNEEVLNKKRLKAEKASKTIEEKLKGKVKVRVDDKTEVYVDKKKYNKLGESGIIQEFNSRKLFFSPK